LCPTIQLVAGLTSEVIDALVRLMKGEVDFDKLDEREVLAILAMGAENRTMLYRAATRLNQQGQGRTFAQIAELLKTEFGVEVHEATIARWAKPPGKDLRRRRRGATGE
jgi:hypothetical protein